MSSRLRCGALALLLGVLSTHVAEGQARQQDSTSTTNVTADWFVTSRPASNAHDDVIAHLRMIESIFFSSWYREWLRSTNARETRPLVEDGKRSVPAVQTLDRRSVLSAIFHCHPVENGGAPMPRAANPEPGMLGPDLFIIRSGQGRHAICPSWTLSPRLVDGDERLHLDTAIDASGREKIRAQRAAIIMQLDRAASTFPDDEWVAGQRVRFLVDQRDTAGAIRAVEQCGGSAWWCRMLGGYVANWRGDRAGADTIFQGALSRAPEAIRCPFTDLTSLLRPQARAPYISLGCAGRQAINERIWWMSDPLYSEPGNERRAEHYARLTMVVLHVTIPEESRYDWSPAFGGNAAQEMLLRYGWPSSAQAAPVSLENQHGNYLQRPRPAHFTTNEYTPDRIHTVPSWPAVLDPSRATERDWVLDAGAAKRWSPSIETWWPAEHFSRDGRSVRQLAGGHQLALFRRDTSVLMALAVALDSADLRVPDGTPVNGSFILTTSANSVELDAVTGKAGAPIVIRKPIVSKPQIAGIEVAYRADAPAMARTRLGLAPPPVLDRLEADSTAISDVAFVSRESVSLAGQSTPDRLLAGLLPGFRFPASTGPAIYWETYGVLPSDTVEFSIKVTALSQPGLLQRIAETIGFAERAAEALSVNWRGPLQDGRGLSVSARTPGIGRYLTLNTAALPPGLYDLTVTVTPRGRPRLVASRRFTIE